MKKITLPPGAGERRAALQEAQWLLDRTGAAGAQGTGDGDVGGGAADGAAEEYAVTGRVGSRTSASVGGLRVAIVDKGIGGDSVLARTETDARGEFRATFSASAIKKRKKQKPDLQAQVFAGERFLAASEVRYDASTRETLDVALDAETTGALRSEYETLCSALRAHFDGNLRDLKETDEQKDVTYLANKSGWDARAVALGALADQLSAGTAEEDVQDSRNASAPRPGGVDAEGGRGPLSNTSRIEPELFYALLRAGVPADEHALYRTDPALVKRTWKRAIEQSVVPASLSERVAPALARFKELAARELLDGPMLAGPSTMKDLLAISLGDDRKKQERFAALYVEHADDRDAFWAAARRELGPETTDRAQLDGRLAYLTRNNAALITKVHAAAGERGLADAAGLVDAGLYDAWRWREVMGDAPVPKEIPGSTAAERRDRYAELLAAQVRLSFPTAVVAQKIASGSTPLASPDTRDGVERFFAEHASTFEIGMQPIARYVAKNRVNVAPEVVHEIARIQRVYQITPSDGAMDALLGAGLDSARAVAAYDRAEFVRAFREELGGEQTALSIHAKASEVHATVLDVALKYLTARLAPGIGGGPGFGGSFIDPTVTPPPDTDDVIAYPTLEGLFGEMDYCECTHCRSVLSPAAYLVDLLELLDRPASEIPAGSSNPQSVLFERRPDIQHLPLTCENTLTPIAYIDLVNETLEHYVSHGLSLAGFAGHTTDGGVPPEDLLASPQFVADAAYTELAGASFPPPLPFDRSLETVRRLFARFDAPLADVMETLRTSDALERASDDAYGRRDVWMEVLGLSREEHALLTERSRFGGETDVMRTVERLYGFPVATADSEVRSLLENARSFCRRVEIRYEELGAILRTRFVNPASHLVPKLERLGVSFATMQALHDGTIDDADFDAELAPGLDPAQYGGDIRAWVRDDANLARIMGLIVLVDTTGESNRSSFESIELRYARPNAAANRLRPVEFARIGRFVRLWKALGWTIEQTDAALTAFFPTEPSLEHPSDAVVLERLDAGFLATLPRLGVLRRAMTTTDWKLDAHLLPLLACASAIDTHGERSLYRQMFVGPSRDDAAFADDGYGNFLDGGELLFAHRPALCAAFTLTADELDAITTALGHDATTPLTIDAISAIFRRGWLARQLSLSVRELLLLVEVTGLDPFGQPDPTSPGILRLLAFVERMRALGVRPAQLLYLVWNHDLSGKSVPSEAEVTSLARNLRVALTAIESELALVDDPDGSIARRHMARIYGSEATELFFGLLDGQLASEIGYDHDSEALEPAIVAVAPGRIAYDDFRKRLSFAGALDATTRDALRDVPGVTATFQAAVSALFDESRSIVEPFFARYPELVALHDGYVASTEPPSERQEALLAALLPELARRRRRQQAIATVSTSASVDPALASALLDDADALHAAADATRPALDDLTALDTGGLAVAFSDAPSSERWTGYLEAPESGFYNVRVDTDPTATVDLTLDSADVALAQDGGRWNNASPIELRAGALVPITVVVENVPDAMTLRWQTAGRGWEIVPESALYSSTRLDALRLAYVRLLKTAALAQALKLSAAEIAHLAADRPIGGEGWMNRLPVVGAGGVDAEGGGGPRSTTLDAAAANELFDVVSVLFDYARLKAAYAPTDERLLDVVRDPAAATAGDTGSLYALTRWERGSVDALLARFGLTTADLAHAPSLARVHDAYELLRKLCVSATALIAAATNVPTAATARDLTAALRARYDERAWGDVQKPIQDDLRARSRDALVAYILHRMRSSPESAHIDTPEKLFELFLMDVQMAPCMLTSRVRHALSAVQLFTERCLMNLEPHVSASSINAKTWAWMKRYRVWEANRKVFLFPENWLEPELRDDPSPMFKETMTELLQGDITEDRAAKALLGYLGKLEEVAKLEVCAVHYEQKQAGFADDVAHVIARTSGGKRRYFYRRREYPTWTPWEKIALDIEDNPVLPVIWRDRLFLFWLKILKETHASAPAVPSADTLAEVDPAQAIPHGTPRVDVSAILTWSEYFDGQWQPPRTSNPRRPLALGTFDHGGAHAFDRDDIRLAAMYWTFDSLRIIVGAKDGTGASFFLHNPFSSPELRAGKKEAHFSPKRTLDTATNTLTVRYSDPAASQDVLTTGIEDDTVEPHHPVTGDPWDVPFFYEDRRHAFFVTTDERWVRLNQWADFGVGMWSPAITGEIAPLVVAPARVGDAVAPIVVSRQPGFGAVDPRPIDRFVTEDAYLENALGTGGTVRYGGRDIGPSGSEIRSIRVR